MTNDVLRYGGRFLFLTVFQILILNNIQLFGYLNPYLYVIFILTLPPNMNRSFLLVLAFLSGWAIDLFENSGGVHASATLLVGFLRPALIRFPVPGLDQDMNRISMWSMGGNRFFTYVGTAVFIHHLWLFGMEAFTLREIGSILTRTLVSAPVTLLVIYISQLFVYREES